MWGHLFFWRSSSFVLHRSDDGFVCMCGCVPTRLHSTNVRFCRTRFVASLFDTKPMSPHDLRGPSSWVDFVDANRPKMRREMGQKQAKTRHERVQKQCFPRNSSRTPGGGPSPGRRSGLGQWERGASLSGQKGQENLIFLLLIPLVGDGNWGVWQSVFLVICEGHGLRVGEGFRDDDGCPAIWCPPSSVRGCEALP